MLKYLLLIAVLAAAIIFGPALSDTQGLVHIAAGDYVIETSLTTAVILLVIAFVVIWLVLRFLGWVLHIPGLSRAFMRRHGNKKALSLASEAVMAFEEGDFERALAITKRLRANGQASVGTLFIAAKSAFALGQYDITRTVLDEAGKYGRHALVASAVVRARLNLRLGNSQAASEILSDLKKNVSSRTVTELLYECHRNERDYAAMQKMVPQLLRQKIISKDEARHINMTYIEEKLQNAATASELSRLYGSLTRDERRNPSVVGPVVNKMMLLGDVSHARKICLDLLKSNPDPEVLENIATWEISIPDVLRLLKKQASGNLIASQVNVPLLKAIGNLELHEGQLKDAQAHYEKAYELSQSRDICLKLATIFSSQRLYDKAALYYEKALKQEPVRLEYRKSGEEDQT